MTPYNAVRLPGGLAGEFEKRILVRLWARKGKHKIELADGKSIYSLSMIRTDIDKSLASLFPRLCTGCGWQTSYDWELTPAPHDRMLCPECAIIRQRAITDGKHVMLGNHEYIKSSFSGSLYPVGTSKDVIHNLDSLASNEIRVKIAYGDPITGRDWQQEFETTGYVTRTMGAHVALLVHNARSMGGSPIYSDSIVRITSTRKSGRVFYEHPLYHVPKVKAVS